MKDQLPQNTPYMNLALWFALAVMGAAVIAPSLHSRQTRVKLQEEIAIINSVDVPTPRYENTTMVQKKAPDSKKTPDPLIGFGIAAEKRFHPIIVEASNQYKVDPAIIKAIIMAESSYNPKALSNKGAGGLMQLMPITAREMGVKDIFNPEHNIYGGVRYYKKLLKQFKGDMELALAAYNAGSRNVREYKGVPPFKATRYYIKKVFEYYQFYKKEMETNKA